MFSIESTTLNNEKSTNQISLISTLIDINILSQNAILFHTLSLDLFL